ncbi:Hypothetical protein GbCGDNIH6_1813 [Granulibacter bethesdensis]|uniref:DUF883 domain-containing protein n=2 Tax=Granulibacter bethesdensis TaxID=364410 RepID=A0AAN0REZ1_9PROT|nr:Hypothetical protein GbCGDNIH3_1813 [Granulibacter bethesdensis]AHJ65735.1 Hypothetical protein GbCGDNIH4_1813 [Granulibacter bethesdensis CGDNIH4]APH57623.1 Hypothetical protein GbCGDNIH6_1813 [Granulibacter bethesdensis]APH60142.1 Hypothetical protein GbCGDNIH7_1813 [Granulibacter bethesdensis]
MTHQGDNLMALFRRSRPSADDAREQILHLREQVEALLNDRVTPALADAAGRAESAARNAQRYTREHSSVICEHVKERPLVALLAAGAAGWLIARIFR